MTERGHYRAIHAVLVDSPEFQDLSPEGMAVFLQVKLRLGASGIGVLGTGAVQDALPKMRERVPEALAELDSGEWTRREGSVIWLRNGLRWDPHISLEHAKQRTGVEAHLRSLPRLQIVLDFADYYGLACPFQKPITKASERLSRPSLVTMPKREEGKGEGKGTEDSAVKTSAVANTLPPVQSARLGGVEKEAEAPRGLLKDSCLRGADAAVIEGEEIGLGLLVTDYRRLLRLGFKDDELRRALAICRLLPGGHEDRAPDGPFTLTWLAPRVDGDLEQRDAARVFRLQEEFRKRNDPPAARSGDNAPTSIGDTVRELVAKVGA